MNKMTLVSAVFSTVAVIALTVAFLIHGPFDGIILKIVTMAFILNIGIAIMQWLRLASDWLFDH